MRLLKTVPGKTQGQKKSCTYKLDPEQSYRVPMLFAAYSSS